MLENMASHYEDFVKCFQCCGERGAALNDDRTDAQRRGCFHYPQKIRTVPWCG